MNQYRAGGLLDESDFFQRGRYAGRHISDVPAEYLEQLLAANRAGIAIFQKADHPALGAAAEEVGASEAAGASVLSAADGALEFAGNACPDSLSRFRRSNSERISDAL